MSAEALEPEEQALYLELAVFWQSQGLDTLDVEKLVTWLGERSLLQQDEQGRIRLHDLQVDYVRQHE